MGKKFTVEGDLGIGELSPGVTKRRWEPEEGVNKLRERIHKESSYTDQHKNLPFTFSKPRRSGRKRYMECDKCGYIIYTSINTVGIICNECKSYVSIKEVLMRD